MTPCRECADCAWVRWDSRHEWCAHPGPCIDSTAPLTRCESFVPAHAEPWAFIMRTNTGIDPRN